MSAVHGKKFYGYQGFVPTYLIHPPSMKTGENHEYLRNKNSSVGQGQVYRKRIGASCMNFDNRTLDADTFANVSKKDYKRADRRGVSANHESADVSERSKPFVGETMYNVTFRNFRVEAQPFLNMMSGDYKDCFDMYATRGELSIKAIPKWLNETVQMLVPDWICIKFMKPFDANPTGRFTFEEFEAAYPTIINAIDMDTKKDVVGKPEWLVASKKMPPKVLTNAGLKSAMQIACPAIDERKWSNKTGLWSCDQDMRAGTTKDTYHIPGYSGHIPASKRNPIVQEQGEAKNPRAIKNNLRLIYSHDLPGYTGHQPRAARNDIGEKKGGRDPRTTSGSAAVGEDIL